MDASIGTHHRLTGGTKYEGIPRIGAIHSPRAIARALFLACSPLIAVMDTGCLSWGITPVCLSGICPELVRQLIGKYCGDSWRRARILAPHLTEIAAPSADFITSLSATSDPFLEEE